VVPNGDLFRALRRGKASIVTDRIESFTRDGIRLVSGAELPADIIVTATGLALQMFGGATVEVDGVPVNTREHLLYKGVLLDGVPNAMLVIGYTNASWTLKADLAAQYFCRVLNHMREHGHTHVVAYAEEGDRSAESVMGGTLTSGYIQRGDAVMPRQGARAPWQVINNYFHDRSMLRRGALSDGVLRFGDRGVMRPSARPATAATPAG
jgi:cation diffusion facilitator CzcD-associated flavoprotein CzcO